MVSYSPFGSGEFPAPGSKGGKVLAEIARARGATPRQVALAFLLQVVPGALVIPKASKVAHVEDNAGAMDLVLSDAEVARIDAVFPKGKRRLHKKPNADEIRACLPWLEAEIELLKPEVIVALGATAARVLVGPSFRVSRQHGEFVDSPLAPHVTATLHPSAILRQRTDAERRRAMRGFVSDLEKVAEVLSERF